MKQILPVLSRGLFYLLALAMVAWTASLTLAFVGRALPNLALARYFALVVFDVGAVAWLLIFLNTAEGLPQRAIAFALSILDLSGVGLMVFTELLTGGQNIVTIPQDLASLALWGIGIWTVVNLVGVFAFHLTEPEIMRQIAYRNQQDKITSKALSMLDKRVDQIADTVAERLAEDMVQATLLALSTRNTVPLLQATQAPAAAPKPQPEAGATVVPPSAPVVASDNGYRSTEAEALNPTG